MEENLGSLGNVEIYFVLEYWDEEYLKRLLKLLPPTPFSAAINNWKDGINKEVDFDLIFFNTNLQKEEEFVLRYEIGDNNISITLIEKRVVICIYFRAWYFLENELINIVKYLITNYKIILLGFELDFKYNREDVESSLNYMKSNKSNYPFILKNREKEIEIYCDRNLLENTNLLSLLKQKVHPVFDMVQPG